MDKLTFIFATREVLSNNGIFQKERRLTASRKRKLEEFQELAIHMPDVHGKIGSEFWIRGALTQLNEPGVIAWEDVEEWVKLPEVLGSLEAVSQREAPTGNIKLVPAFRREGVLRGGSRHIPRLKHAMIQMGRKCEAPPAKVETTGRISNAETGNSSMETEQEELPGPSSAMRRLRPRPVQREQVVPAPSQMPSTSDGALDVLDLDDSNPNKPLPSTSVFREMEELLHQAEQKRPFLQNDISGGQPCDLCIPTKVDSLMRMGEFILNLSTKVGHLRLHLVKQDPETGLVAVPYVSDIESFIGEQCADLRTRLADTLTSLPY